LAIDGARNLYVVDEYGYTVRKITPAGEVTTLAGKGGEAGSTNGSGAGARFGEMRGIALDGSGNVYVADTGNRTIRKISASGTVTTLAGKAGAFGHKDGVGGAARFEFANGVAVDAVGNVFVAEFDYIRKITPAGKTSTLAGKRENGSADGPASAATFRGCAALVVDAAGNILVIEERNNTLRKLSASGTATTVAGAAAIRGSADGAGNAASFYDPTGMGVDGSGNFYVADSENNTIRKISSAGTVTTLVGSPGREGSADGTAGTARFSFPFVLAVSADGTVYVSDLGNETIRKITPAGVVTTLAGSPGKSGKADGIGAVARFNNAQGIAVDSNGNVYVADTLNGTIRKITSAGVVTTLAGRAGQGGGADGTGSAARFGFPRALAVDNDGTIFVADDRLRKVTSAGVVTTLALTDEAGNPTDLWAEGLAVDETGTIYAAADGVVRKISSAGVVSSIGGNDNSSGNVPGVGSVARFSGTAGIAVGPDRGVYVLNERGQNITVGRPYLDLEVAQGGTMLASGAGTVDHGQVNSGAAGSTRTFTLTNRGIAPVSELAVGVADGPAGNAPGDYAVTAPLGATTLATGESTTFTVTFTPGALGVRMATLQLEYEVPEEPSASPFEVTLRGIGVDSALPAVLIASTNADPAWARMGNTLTLDFTSGEPIQTPTVTLLGNVVAAANVSGNRWTASATVGGNTQEGVAAFAIQATKVAGGTVTVGTTTDGSQVTVDRTPPLASISSEIDLGAGLTGRVPLAGLTESLTFSDALGIPTVTQIPAATTVVRRGTYPVSFTVRDDAGNETSVSTEVRVVFFQYENAAISYLRAGTKLGQPVSTESGLPEDTFLASLATPAVSDDRQMVTRATVFRGRAKLGAIFVQDGAGESLVPVYQSGPAPNAEGSGFLPNVTFKSFLDPVTAPGGAIAFAATLQGTGAKGAAVGAWSDLTSPGVLQLLLREGTAVPGLAGGEKLKAVTSLALRDGGLLALVKMGRVPNAVTAANDTALVLLKPAPAPAVALLRTGTLLGGEAGATIQSFSVLQPAQFSAGQGRWFADGAVVAKVTLASGEVRLVGLADTGAVIPLLSTMAAPSAAISNFDPAAKWKSFGLPSQGGPAAEFAVTAVFQSGLGGVTPADDEVVLGSADGSDWNILARKGDQIPPYDGDLLFVGFSDPASNDVGDVAFLATLSGLGVTESTKSALFAGPPADLEQIARLGGFATDEGGNDTGATWSRFLTFALTSGDVSGNGAGVVFLAETRGGDTKGTNKLGLWVKTPFDGTRRIMRTGDFQSPFGANLKNITLLNALPGSYGAARSLNATGSVAMLATFSDGTQELLRVDIP